MKQTAVEWLVEKLSNLKPEDMTSIFDIRLVIQQAKAMEKEQIIQANEDFSTNSLGELLTGEQYYNETYK